MRSFWFWIAASSFLALAGCVTVPAGNPRDALVMPKAIATRYSLCESSPKVTIHSSQRWEGFTLSKGQFATADEIGVAFEFFEPEGEEARAFVMVLPYLEGSYRIPRMLCKSLARHGIASAFLERPADILAPDQSGASAERQFASTISRYRAFFRWAGERPSIDRTRLGLAGISLGAIMGTALMAAEPQLAKGMLILPGGDIPQILLRSRETKVIEYLQARGAKDSLTPAQIAEDFRENFQSDPLLLAPYVDPRKILMVTARYDNVIPRDCSDRLWQELGCPERILLPTGHGTAGFAFPHIDARMIRFFSQWEAGNEIKLATLPR